ncbi:MAG: DUF1616 domain-containing protein [Candidatus Bathyarchaeota archaeon]|nr:DUF1616 domain-containing protein [Candidatus Bathyarchaeota archaeon]
MAERDGDRVMSESLGWRERLRGLLDSEESEEPEHVEESEFVVSEAALGVVMECRGEPVEDVVEALSSLPDSGFVEASRVVYQLVNEGELRLRDPDPPGDIPSYLFSWYSLWFWVVLGFLVVVSLSVFVLPQVSPWVYLRYVGGAVYVLYVPGAVFIEMLYPKRVELEDLERFALGVGLSLAIVPLVGLVLNYTPWGIRLNPIYVGLSMLTIVFGGAGVYRKYQYFRLGLEADR